MSDFVTDRIYRGLSRASYMGALAETQALHNRAIASNDVQMIDVWNREVTRISSIIENWDFLSQEVDR